MNNVSNLLGIMAGQPTPLQPITLRNSGLIRPRKGKPMVNTVRPYFREVYLRGGRLTIAINKWIQNYRL